MVSNLKCTVQGLDGQSTTQVCHVSTFNNIGSSTSHQKKYGHVTSEL